MLKGQILNRFPIKPPIYGLIATNNKDDSLLSRLLF